MSIAALTRRLGTPEVPPVPSPKPPEGTGEPFCNQRGAPGSLGSPERRDQANTMADTPSPREPLPPLTATAENAIRAWLAHISETDPAAITEVLDRCRKDAQARAYFLRRASECRSGSIPADAQAT